MATLERTSTDRRLVYGDRTWQQFQLIRAGFADAPGIRLFYSAQTVEILMPGQPHELFKSILGLLLEIFLVEQDCEFEPTGSMDLVREGEVFAQADETYSFPRMQGVPDLAIEIVFSSGNTRKLARYQRLGVPEVWFWEDGSLALYHLCSNNAEVGYEQVKSSQLPALKTLNIDLLGRCVLLGETSRLNAVKTFKAGL